MSQAPVFIKNIEQKDNHTFQIQWSDGILSAYRLYDLQKNCPCAKCRDETTGDSRIEQSSLNYDVRAFRLINVGRYAIKVEFTSGCSAGIYSYDMLRKLVDSAKAKSHV